MAKNHTLGQRPSLGCRNTEGSASTNCGEYLATVDLLPISRSFAWICKSASVHSPRLARCIKETKLSACARRSTCVAHVKSLQKPAASFNIPSHPSSSPLSLQVAWGHFHTKHLISWHKHAEVAIAASNRRHKALRLKPTRLRQETQRKAPHDVPFLEQTSGQ